MKSLVIVIACCVFSPFVSAQNASEWLAGLPQAKDYVEKRASITTAAVAMRITGEIAPGETLGADGRALALVRSRISGRRCGRRALR